MQVWRTVLATLTLVLVKVVRLSPKYGPQTLNKVSDFIGRVVKGKSKGMSMKKAVQQTLNSETHLTSVK